jgi:hypothetical protein
MLGTSYALRVESTVVSLWRGTKLVESQRLDGTGGAEDFYAQLGMALSALLSHVSVRGAREASIYLGQGLVQHSVIALDARRLKSHQLASAVQGFWTDANGGNGSQNQVAWQIQQGGVSIFSSCCEAQLVSNIQTIFKASEWAVARVTTHAAQVWNSHRSQIRINEQCMLILQDNVLSMGLQQKGIWRAWSSENCFDTEWIALSNRAARFLRSTGLCDAETTPKCVYAPHLQGSPIAAGLHNWMTFTDKLSGASLAKP